MQVLGEKGIEVDEDQSGKIDGGDEGTRTPGLYVANVPLSRLSYIPIQLSCRWTLPCQSIKSWIIFKTS